MAVTLADAANIEQRVLRSVELQLAQRLGERSSTRIGLEDQDGWVVLTVADTGRGIPPDELLVTDRPLLATVLLYAATAAVVLKFHTHLITRISL